MVTIFKEFHFEAAHSLPHLPRSHKCRAVHGHSYLTRVEVSGRVSQETGWVIDYADISRAWDEIFVLLDHKYLNDIQGLEISTSEHLAKWIWGRLEPALPGLSAVEVRETPTAGAIYRG